MGILASIRGAGRGLISASGLTLTNNRLAGRSSSLAAGAIEQITPQTPLVLDQGNLQITVATAKLLGRSTAGTGTVEEIGLGSGLSFSGTTLNSTGTGTGTAGIASLTPPTVAGFSAVTTTGGRAGASTTDVSYGVQMRGNAPASSTTLLQANCRVLPSTGATGIRLTICFRPVWPLGTPVASGGIQLTDGTKYESFMYANDTGYSAWVYTWTNSTTFGAASQKLALGAMDVIWMRLRIAGGNRFWDLSMNGIDFTQIFTEANSVHLTPTHWGWGQNANATGTFSGQSIGVDFLSAVSEGY